MLNARRSLYSACMRRGRSNFTKVISLFLFSDLFVCFISPPNAQFFSIISFVVGVPFVYGNLCRWIGCWQSSNFKSMNSDIMTGHKYQRSDTAKMCSIDTLKNFTRKVRLGETLYALWIAESFFNKWHVTQGACHFIQPNAVCFFPFSNLKR